jgi:type IV pilus assembly protein PilA
MDTRTERGIVASGLVVGVAVAVLLAAVSFVLLAKRGGEEAASAASGALDAAAESQDRAAQSSLRNALAAAKTIYTDSDSYGDVSPATMVQIEPSLSYVDGGSTGVTVVSVVATDQQVGLAAMSVTGTCWWLHDDATGGGTTYGSGSACTGQDALAGATATSW